MILVGLGLYPGAALMAMAAPAAPIAGTVLGIRVGSVMVALVSRLVGGPIHDDRAPSPEAQRGGAENPAPPVHEDVW